MTGRQYRKACRHRFDHRDRLALERIPCGKCENVAFLKDSDLFVAGTWTQELNIRIDRVFFRPFDCPLRLRKRRIADKSKSNIGHLLKDVRDRTKQIKKAFGFDQPSQEKNGLSGRNLRRIDAYPCMLGRWWEEYR